MSWFAGNRTGSKPEHSSNYINKQKHKQIESLREQIPGVVEITRDEHYSVSTTVNGITLTLNIILPQRFPLVGPEISITPPVKHPWVNDEMVVDGSPLLKNFTIHSKLGRAIDQVIRELQEQPPQLAADTPLPYAAYPMPGSSNIPSPSLSGAFSHPATITSPSASGGFSSYLFSSNPQTSSKGVAPDSPGSRDPGHNGAREGFTGYRCPPIPDSFEEVKEMSVKELKRYLNDIEDTVLIEDFVSKLDLIKMMQLDREHLIQDNEDQAAINLSHEPELQEGWTSLQEMYFKIENLKEKHEQMLQEQRRLIDHYKPKNVITQLKALGNGVDIESEILAEEFLEAKISVTDFIQKHKQQRKLYHLRKTKYEKLVYH